MNQKTRITVIKKPGFTDPHAIKLKQSISEYFNLNVESVKISHVYTIHKPLSPAQVNDVKSELFSDHITEIAHADSPHDETNDWTIEVGFKPGVTDNAGMTAQLTLEDFLSYRFEPNECVKTSTQYSLKGDLTFRDIKKISLELIANPLIEAISIHGKQRLPVEIVDLNISDEDLMEVSRKGGLALNLKEMQTIKTYFEKNTVKQARSKVGLPSSPTDVELEAIAQTWSEHCKHKIFNAKIHYKENNQTENIDSLFKTYIKKATDKLSEKVDWLVSTFTDNAGIIKFNQNYNIAFKVETHNSPSALDPYGGALTGILGVNRDIMGAGIGARLVANTDVFCFAPLDYDKKLPARLLHPKRVYNGVRLGVEHGGNKSGVPTVNGTVAFDKRYLGKPLVYCGTVGIMPAVINKTPTHVKEIKPGDLVVITGGRTGKDGIHGATFSSEELHEQSPSSAVQIGDPFTQKKLHDFLLEARNKGLYRTLTDNGAGGFSSSVGELATLSGGCEMHLEKALLKYPGLEPWEILVSESQERMTLAVDQTKEKELCDLALKHEVDIVTLGTFTDSNYFHIYYEGKTVAYLPLDFLHDGVPQLELEAKWTSPKEIPLTLPKETDYTTVLHYLLTRFNICSKESIVRQYDHEVQGGSVIKPLMGRYNDGPSDAAIVRPIECLDGKEGIVISNGICPRYSDIDTYHMTACAIDEAIRNAVCVGSDPSYISILDNFCWPDPIYDPEKTPDGKHKLAQLVRSNKALYETALAFETPIISGKDSMKNDYKMDGVKISVPPTLLISAMGKIHNITKAVSMDLKIAGDAIYILGLTKNELGASEYADMLELKAGIVPKVETRSAKKLYTKLHQAIAHDLIASCHDCSDGGLAVALAETSFAGNLGVEIDLTKVPTDSLESNSEILFSESPSRLVVSVAQENISAFERYMKECIFSQIGSVRSDTAFIVNGLDQNIIIKEDIKQLKASWQKRLK